MVTDSHTRSDRAQLVLIAAIALAFIILGIVVVFNSVLYTQTMSSSSSIETTSDAQLAELEMARGVRGIAQEVNLDSSLDGGDLDDVNTTLEGNSSAFVGQYHNATVTRQPAIVDVSDVGTSEPARAINDDIPADEVFNSSVAREIGHFVLKLEADAYSGKQITVTAINDSPVDNETRLEIEGNSDGFEFDDLDGTECTVEQPEEFVVFDFTTGEIVGGQTGTGDCSIDLIDPNESYESLEFDRAGDGDYELVARGDSPLTPSGSSDEHLAAWAVDLEYTYDTNELTVDRQFEVDVYGDRR